MPGAFLFDTNIATAMWDMGSKYHQKAREFASSLDKNDEIIISAVTLAEVEYGLRTAPKIDAARQEMERNAMGIYAFTLPITGSTVEYYSEIRSKLFMKYSPRNARGRLTQHWVEDLLERTPGKLLGAQENDIWIAAQAMEMDLVLVAEDKHMDRIASLQLNPGLHIRHWR